MKKLIIGVLLLFNSVEMIGQKVQGDPNVWFLMLNHYSINEKWQIGNELHVRRNDWLKEQAQFLIRPYINYKINNAVMLTAGYTYLKTTPFGDLPLPIAIPEQNIWEQLTLNHSIGKLKFSHRLRLEQRFIGLPTENSTGDYEIEGHKFTTRFRYRLTLKRDLNEKWFAHVFDEVWIHQDGLKLSSFDRNWLYVGVGYRVKDQANVQLGYMHQWIRVDEDMHIEIPTLQLTIQYDF